MSAPRFFVSVALSPGLEIALDHIDSRHAALVLRLRSGDAIVLVHDGTVWDAIITEARASGIRARIGNAIHETGGELPGEITVIQALTKGTKFDGIVEKVVELGARRIVPVRCERSYGDASRAKVERWRRIARSAAQQSRRHMLPEVSELRDWIAAVTEFARHSDCYVAYERAAGGSLIEALARRSRRSSFTIALGPEGGLTQAEIDAAQQAGAAIVSLGPTILRTETAAPAMLAAIACALGWW